MYKLKFLIFVFILKLTYCDEIADLVKVTLGNGNQLLGLEQKSLFTSKKFIEFRGIPYATASRFKAPEPYKEKWTEPREAVEYGNICPQDDQLFNDDDIIEGDIEEIVQPVGNEDCLFLNIATSSLTGPPLPVVVWFHGGAFQSEFGNAFGPRKFMEHPLVLVTFNYRLGALGFLSTGDGKIQGNFGLKDQNMALLWVKENIETFNGDKNNITLMGVNTGAVSIHLHMLSAMSEDLFHRVILQSPPWAIQTNATKIAQNYYEWFEDCIAIDNSTESLPIYDCLMNAKTETLIRKQSRLIEWYIDPLISFGPSIETIGDEPKFLSEEPFSILQSGRYWAKGKVSIMAGVNEKEGLLHSWDIAHHKILSQTLNMEWERALPITLAYKDIALSFKNISNSVFSFYFDSDNYYQKQSKGKERERKRIQNIKNKKMIARDFYKFDELTDLYSDRYFFIPLHKLGYYHGLHNFQVSASSDPTKEATPVYLYWFDYIGAQSLTQFSGYNDTVYGAAHYDQIQYLFNTPYFKDSMPEEDIAFGQNFMKGLVRFITEGKPPAGGWVPLTKEMIEGSVPFIYNRIGSTKRAYQIIEPFIKRLEFWDSLPLLEYGKKATDFPEYANDDSDREYYDPFLSEEEIEKLKAKLEL